MRKNLNFSTFVWGLFAYFAEKLRTMVALLQFSVANFRSIHTRKTISFLASSIKDEPRENVVVFDRIKYLSSCAIYGANSSGKSNLVLAMGMMTDIIFDSAKMNDGDTLPYDPFALALGSLAKPTSFEMTFAVSNRRYRYGFEYNEERIVSEWLYRSSTRLAKETPLFVRTEEGIGINEEAFLEGDGLEGKTNANRLFLSLVAQLGGDDTISKEVMSFFRKINVISGLNSTGYRNVTKEFFLNNQQEADEAVRLFKELQLGFDDISVKEVRNNGNRPEIQIYTRHAVYSKTGTPKRNLYFDMDYMESAGTKKLFELAGPIVNTLLNGKILVIDELDAKMHPLISQHLVGIFNDPRKNSHNAQLIFTTHDTHLLSSALLRRDQIWFTEKNDQEETDVYSMMDILLPDGSKPRSDSNLEKNYIMGRYGAIPFILND